MDDSNKYDSEEENNTNETALKSNMKPNKYTRFAKIFKICTDCDLEHFTSFQNFTKWLHRPVDASALGVFRMLYGVAMLIDIAEERGGSQLDLRFGEPKHCYFPLIDVIQAFSFPVMGCVYLCMWLGAIGIMLGYHFRLSCLSFIVPYWYIFLLNKPAWNNHSYLFGLVGSILLFTKANHYWSIDKCITSDLPSTVPYWNYFLIKFQFFVLYMYAGLKKLTAEWLSGYSMSSLSQHWVLSPFRWIFTAEWADLLIVHWFTAIFDFTIAFLMTSSKTRVFATPFMISFHLMNSRLFTIGMFPWVCLAQVPMFYGCDWPRKISLDNLKKLCKTGGIQQKKDQTEILESETQSELSRTHDDDEPIVHCSACKNLILPSRKNISLGQRIRSFIIIFYCGLQLFLPYSHFITQGYNNWTNGLYGYSWDMMVHSYDTILTVIKVVDNANGKEHFMNPYAFTEYDRWSKYADMAKQYAHCIQKNIEQEHWRNVARSPLSSTNISIYFDVWCSMNGRFQQRVFDPRVDLLKAEWSPFKRTSWSFPLLNELNHLRPKLRNIANEVLAWNKYSDVIFVADFPGLTLDNYISPDLTNVSLTILEGNVRYYNDNINDTSYLTSGNSISLSSGIMHHVTTVGVKPSCYLFIYSNKTMQEENIIIENSIDGKIEKPLMPLWQEFVMRIKNYKRFLQHICNCILYLLYDVPIPMEIREKTEKENTMY